MPDDVNNEAITTLLKQALAHVKEHGNVSPQQAAMLMGIVRAHQMNTEDSPILAMYLDDDAALADDNLPLAITAQINSYVLDSPELLGKTLAVMLEGIMQELVPDDTNARTKATILTMNAMSSNLTVSRNITRAVREHLEDMVRESAKPKSKPH